MRFQDCTICGVNYNADTFDASNPHRCDPPVVVQRVIQLGAQLAAERERTNQLRTEVLDALQKLSIEKNLVALGCEAREKAERERDALVAQAVQAERQRCAGIARANVQDYYGEGSEQLAERVAWEISRGFSVAAPKAPSC